MARTMSRSDATRAIVVLLAVLCTPSIAPGGTLEELIDRLAAVPSVQPSTVDSIRFHAYSASLWRRLDPVFASLMYDRGSALARAALEGRDPFRSTTGIVYRAMRSPFAPGGLRPYGLYVPPSYDPSRRYPLLVLLRGGTSDHMSLLRQILGYPPGEGETKTLIGRRPISARRLPDWGWLIATPSGYGNTMFAGVGEEEVLEVLADVQQHYSIDRDRVVLAGVSRGGYAAVNLGVRYAGRFAAVVDLCGFADPIIQKQRHTRERPLRGFERRLLAMQRPLELAERTFGTPLYFVVGGRDPGTWPAGLRMLAGRVDAVGGGHTWIEWPWAYHAVWVPAFRNGALLKRLDGVRRDSRPSRVVLRAGLYRDAEQRWVRVEQMARFGQPVRVEATVTSEGRQVDVQTENVEAMRLGLDEAPVSDSVELRVDGRIAYRGPGRPLDLVRGVDGGFVLRPTGAGAPQEPRKVRGLSGPIEDRDHGPTAYVYGTGRSRAIEALRSAAVRASRGSFGGGGVVWREGPVVADVDYEPSRYPGHHLALYGHAGENSWTAQVAAALPIGVADGFIELRGRLLDQPGDGIRLVYPNPFEPGRYVEVVAAIDADDVLGAVRLPSAYLPDYLVFSRATIGRSWEQLLPPRAGFHEAGFFDEHWRLLAESQLRPAPTGTGMEALP